MENGKVIKGSLLLAAGAFLSKLIGAVYRIPLTNLLGGEGLGLYQMVFPIYCVLLDFSGAGAPSAISKLISENDRDYGVNLFKGSLRVMSSAGAVGAVLMCVFALPVSVAQGNSNAYAGYVFLAPAVLFVSVISCYRGYFQGIMNMVPTAVSQVIEQATKLLFGLLLVNFFKSNTVKAVAGATFAVTLSEIFALAYLIVAYKTYEKKNEISVVFDKSRFKSQLGKLVKYTVLVTLIGIAIPLSQVLDSFLMVNILSGYRTDATALYGLYSGAATTVINLPVSVCYGIATVAVPAVSGAAKNDKRRYAARTLFLTLAASVPFAVLCFVFSPFAVRVLFGGLSAAERAVTVKLIRYLSVNVVLLSFLQTANAALIGSGKLFYPLIGMGAGIAVKILLDVFLLPIPNLNIYGGVIAVIACYFTAGLINLILISKLKVKNAGKKFDRGQCLCS